MSVSVDLSGPWFLWALIVLSLLVGMFILYGAIAEAYLAGVRRAWEDTIKEAEKALRQQDAKKVVRLVPLQGEDDGEA